MSQGGQVREVFSSFSRLSSFWFDPRVATCPRYEQATPLPPASSHRRCPSRRRASRRARQWPAVSRYAPDSENAATRAVVRQRCRQRERAALR